MSPLSSLNPSLRKKVEEALTETTDEEDKPSLIVGVQVESATAADNRSHASWREEQAKQRRGFNLPVLLPYTQQQDEIPRSSEDKAFLLLPLHVDEYAPNPTIWDNNVSKSMI